MMKNNLMKIFFQIITLVASVGFFTDFSHAIDRRHLQALGLQELNQEAPDFSLTDSAGQRISLKELKGKVVILHFWATWCKPCKDELPAFEKLYQETKAADVVFLPISIDTRGTYKEIQAFAKGLGISIPVYWAKEGSVPDRYWTWGVPVTYFIEKKGFIVARAIGPRDWSSGAARNLISALRTDEKP